MTKAAEKILEDARALGRDEKIEVAEMLLAEVGPSTDPDYVAAWDAEIGNRLAQYERGEVQGIPWEVVRKKLMDRIKDAKAARRPSARG